MRAPHPPREELSLLSRCPLASDSPATFFFLLSILLLCGDRTGHRIARLMQLVSEGNRRRCCGMFQSLATAAPPTIKGGGVLFGVLDVRTFLPLILSQRANFDASHHQSAKNAIG